MKVIHLSVARQFSPGQLKQLGMEQSASTRLPAGKWCTLAYHDGPAVDGLVKRVPWLFRSVFARKLWTWLVALSASRKCDFLVMRHVTFDPYGPLFAPFIRNRVSVHHAKEVEELRLIRGGWRGRAASAVERVCGRITARHVRAILGVTLEIARYQCSARGVDKPIGVYSNGIDPLLVPVLDDHRSHGEVVVAFICGTFAEWHGLDKLVAAVDAHADDAEMRRLTIHLIGGLTAEQFAEVTATRARREVFRSHGLLGADQYRLILAGCDVGLGSLAMERQNLREGSTLKVREMLAMGLAVYSGHEDIALPKEQGFAHVTSAVSVHELVSFAEATKLITRRSIRERSLGYVDKLASMETVMTRLHSLS